MFEVGFSEMLLIGVVALIVLGPERLPRAARMAGLWIRRLRAYWFSMQSQLEQELAAEEMRKHLREVQSDLVSVDTHVREATRRVDAPEPLASGVAAKPDKHPDERA